MMRWRCGILNFEKESGMVRCEVCPHHCYIPEGEFGKCGIWKNEGGKLVNPMDGKVSVVAVERIEKKPIFHFHPNTLMLTVGFVGCNLRCLYCQNYEISRQTARTYRHFAELTEEKVLELLDKNNLDGVAFSYTEPTINWTYVERVAKAVKESGRFSVISTNGYVEPWVVERLARWIDAWNVDVKAFDDEFYQKVVGGHLKPVLNTIDYLIQMHKHVEVTYLMIPEMNDDDAQLRSFARWVASRDVKAVHVPRFYPHYLMKDKRATRMESIERFVSILQSEGVERIHGGWEEAFGLWKARNSAVAEVERA